MRSNMQAMPLQRRLAALKRYTARRPVVRQGPCPENLTSTAMATIRSETSIALLERLRGIVGQANVLVGDDVSARATHFWNPAPLTAKAIVRPATTAETSAVLAACHADGQSIVTHGGVTGLVDGDRSDENDIIVSLERLRDIEAIDPIGRTITVGAGCVLERVQEAAVAAGLQFGLDLGARGSCTVGGNLSTNAGGLSVLRYGMAREQVLGLEAVMADGTVISSMNRMLKNNAGYDLKQLFIGSEGTLGIITRVVLRLRAATPSVQTALVAFERYEQVTAMLAHMDHTLNGTLNAYEVIWQSFYRLNTDATMEGGMAAPLERDYPLYAIVESRGADPTSDETTFQAALESAFEQSYIVDAVVPQSNRERADIWRLRETIEIALRHDPIFVYDISLPIVDMARYVDELESALQVEWPDVSFYAYGHLADSNLHLMVAPRPFGNEDRLPPADTLAAWHDTSDRLVYSPLERLGGSVSAEHGIGLMKKAHLPRSRTSEEIELMRALKGLLDPRAILNPGKVV